MNTRRYVQSCPFCQRSMSDEDLSFVVQGNTMYMGVRVECVCGVKGKSFEYDTTLKDRDYYFNRAKNLAIDWWNSRRDFTFIDSIRESIRKVRLNLNI